MDELLRPVGGAPTGELLRAAATVVAACLAALLAGYFGAVFGSTKLRGEQAFASRLDWYKRVTAALRRLEFDIGVAVTYQLEGTVPSGNWMVVREHSYIPLFMLIGEAEIFATPAGLKVIREFSTSLDHVSRATDYFGASGMQKPGSLKEATDLQTSARKARAALVTDIRKHLKFEGIEPELPSGADGRPPSDTAP